MSEVAVTLNTICSIDVLHAAPQDSILVILRRMRQSHVSSIVIIEQNAPLGIITEKDIIRLVSTSDPDLELLTAADIMTSPVKTMYADCDFQLAYEQMQQENLRHIIVTNKDGSLRGIATETDFVQHLGFEYLAEIKHVEAVMERSVLFVSADSSLRHAFQIMNEEMISSVVVANEGVAEGILTERDVVRLLDEQVNLDDAVVSQYMSSPVEMIQSGTSLLEARHIMEEKKVRRLLVCDDDKKIQGLLTRQHLIDRLQTHFIKMMQDAIDNLNHQLQSSRHKETHYRGFFENSPFAYQSLNAEGNILEVNACWREMMGYSSHEIIGTAFKTLLADGQEEKFNHCFSSLMDKGATSDVYYQLLTKDGQTLDIQIDAQLVLDDQQRLVQTHCLLTNLTEKHRIDSQLRLFRQLIDRSNDALFVIDAATSKIIDLNQASCDYLGYSREELLQTFVTNFSEDASSIEKWQAQIAKIQADEKGGLFEEVHQTSEGRRVPVEISATLQQANDQLVVLYTVRDITERKQAELKSREESNFLQAVIDCIGDPVMVIDTNYKVIKSNRTANDYFFNCQLQEDVPCYLQVDDTGSPCKICPLKEVMEHKRPTTRIHEHVISSGEKRTFELMASPLYDAEGQVTGLVESSRDVTEHIRIQKRLREKEKSLDFLAHHDPLTKLPNRLLFSDRLKQALRHAKRTKTGLALLFIDLDEFKEINDSFGHNLGDQLLKKVSARLQEHVRANDTIARLGGDEFTIIVEDLTHPNDAALVAQNLLDAFNHPIELDEHQLHVSLSIGISLYPEDAEFTEALIRNADTAMYRAKASGKNRYDFYTQDMTDQAFERILMVGAMRNAIEHEQFVVHYQPQIDVRDNSIIGAEALIRWQDPQLGTIEPGRFIPLAEKTGMIQVIDRWVLDTVCRNISEWQQAGYNVPRISVNISTRHFGSNTLAGEVADILKRNDCASEMIELEITEGVIMNNPNNAGNELEQLRKMGIRLAIDDFGTGYSSLSYLKKLPLDRLKIDHSFITDIPEDNNDQAISRAIIAMANSLGLEVIAEGMESEEQRQFLIDEKCFYAQGFLFSKGVPEHSFLSMLKQH
ncbi:EAL domain-containing protein [Amphritea japonica]|uniref:cyclic-guanylate-specific phosphodiesterase n=1 Tax=Amphritea japonica ATCC BAA-1530 TaxID=1278309 RepID=A0A7R6PMS9_9GAMM|nr:EAL domain-containing protein [Amphritea japonica]BBB26263.1 signal transduction protein [Amphritea japonica ATCC BAA-1530]